MDAFSFIYFGRVSSIHKGNKIAQVNVCKSIPVLATPETFLENNQWPAPHCNQISGIVFIIVLSHWMHLRSRGQGAIPKIAWFPSREKGPGGDMSSRYISRNSNLTPMKWSRYEGQQRFMYLRTLRGPSPGAPAPPRMQVDTHLRVHDSAFADFGLCILCALSAPASRNRKVIQCWQRKKEAVDSDWW